MCDGWAARSAPGTWFGCSGMGYRNGRERVLGDSGPSRGVRFGAGLSGYPPTRFREPCRNIWRVGVAEKSSARPIGATNRMTSPLAPGPRKRKIPRSTTVLVVPDERPSGSAERGSLFSSFSPVPDRGPKNQRGRRRRPESWRKQCAYERRDEALRQQGYS